MAESVKPIDGPGGGGIALRGPLRNVARLSSKAKFMLVVAGVVVAGGIVIGTMTAGLSNVAQVAAETGTSMDGIGTIAAPQAPTSTSNPNASASLAPRTVGEVPLQGNPDAVPASNLQRGNTTPSPVQQHKEWAQKHKYQRIEGLILASEAALTSETSKGGGSTMAATHKSSVQQQGPDELEDPVAMSARHYEDSRQHLENMQLAELDRAREANSTAASVSHRQPLVPADMEEPGSGQLQNKAFLKDMQKSAEDGYLPEIRKPSLAATSLLAGSVIPAVLITGINSDLPGTISAQVRETVYDSRNPNLVLIPQGSRLVGEYSAEVGYGQKRVLIAWNHLIFPDGSTINMKGMMGGDGQGRSGFEDQVDNHYIRTFGSAILISMLGVGAQLSQPQNSGSLNSPPAGAQAAGAMASSMNSTGSKVLNKNLNIQPTLEIRPGYTFNVLVNRTMILPPYQPAS